MVAELLPMFHQQETVNESVFCLGSSRVKNNGTQPLFVCPEDIFFNKELNIKALITHYKGIDW